ncbi:MAG: hypothetical protein QGG48_04795, partial [Desulfatiglandales bacterium]|nr:hypothetical protein [Desulfatiglandales bacterium]
FILGRNDLKQYITPLPAGKRYIPLALFRFTGTSCPKYAASGTSRSPAFARKPFWTKMSLCIKLTHEQ